MHKCKGIYKNRLSPHNSNYVVFLFLYHETQPLNLSAMFCSCGHNIDSRGIDTAVAQDIRQLGDVLFNAVKGSCKEFPEIMWEYFGRVHTCCSTQPLHLCPDIAAIHGLPILCNKDRTALDSAMLRVIQ